MNTNALKLPQMIEEALNKRNYNDYAQEIKVAYREMKDAIETGQFKNLFPLLHASLTTMASLCWSDFNLPVTLVAVGPPSSGKTEPLMWLVRSASEIIVRVDSFTSKAFVSHAANIKKKDLEKIDLLPKLKDRCLCTKELAPLFSQREDDLKTSFAQLASILDGEGLVSSSGTQGTRGYSERINFVWLGATTPLKRKVFALMAALGTRIFFYSTDFNRPTAQEYANSLLSKRNQSCDREKAIAAVSKYLETIFTLLPMRSVAFDNINIPEHICKLLGSLCELLTRLRGGLSMGEGETSEDDRYEAPDIEHGWRANQVIAAFVRGSALVKGSANATMEDYNFAKHIVLSSMPEHRRRIFEAIVACDGDAIASDVVRIGKMAKKTALHGLKELKILGVVDGGLDTEPYRFKLKDEFRCLLDQLGHTPTNLETPAVEVPEEQIKHQNDLLFGVTKSAGVCEKIKDSDLPIIPEGF